VAPYTRPRLTADTRTTCAGEDTQQHPHLASSAQAHMRRKTHRSTSSAEASLNLNLDEETDFLPA